MNPQTNDFSESYLEFVVFKLLSPVNEISLEVSFRATQRFSVCCSLEASTDVKQASQKGNL